VGLQYTCKLPDTQVANDLYTSIKRGDIDGSSFGFECVDDEWDDDNVRKMMALIESPQGQKTGVASDLATGKIGVDGLLT